MKYGQIVKFVSESPWAIRPSKLAVILDLVAYNAAGGKLSDDEVQERLASIEAARQRGPTSVPSQGSVAVLPLYGVITPKAGLMSSISGGCALDTWASDFAALLGDDSVGAIVLDCDSPGGSVEMLPETAAMIYSARGKGKPIVASVNAECASAAYWLASQCDEICITPSGEAGSIGVYAAHQDISQALEMEGVKMTLISAGEYKTEGNPYEPLSDEARAAIQASVNYCYGQFTSAVAKGRGVSQQDVLAGYGQGRMMNAQDAVKENLADRIEPLTATVGRLGGGKMVPRKPGRRGEDVEGVTEGDLAMAAAANELAGSGLMASEGTHLNSSGGLSDVRIHEPAEQPEAAEQQPELVATAVPPKGTALVDKPWDGPAAEAALDAPITKARGLGMYAWYDAKAADPDGDGYPDAKAAWKFPHHEVTGGDPGPANINGVRNAMARVADADIPDPDRAGVRAHLQKHLDDWQEENKEPAGKEEPEGAAQGGAAVTAGATHDTGRTGMRSLEALVARQAEINARKRELDAEYEGLLMPAEARSELDGLDAEWTDLEMARRDIIDRKARLARTGANEQVDDDTPEAGGNYGGGGGNGTHQPGSDTPQYGEGLQVRRSSRLPENIFDLAAYRQRANTVEQMGSLYREGAKRALEGAAIPIDGVDTAKSKGHITNLLSRDSQDGLVARHILATGSPMYLTAFKKALQGKHLSQAESFALDLYGLTIGTPSDGGFAIPYNLDPTVILSSAGSVNPLRQISSVETIVGNHWLGVTSDGIVASYGAEGSAATDDSPVLAQPEAFVEKAKAFVPFSIEVSQDWGALETTLARLFADGKDNLEATKFFTGAGHGSEEPEGLITGLIGSPSVIDTATIGTIAREDLYGLDDELPDRFNDGASAVAHRAFYNAVRALADDDFDLYLRIGQNIGTNPIGNTNAELLGYPAWRASGMSKALTTGNEIVLVLGDYRQGFKIIDRIGMSVELIPHLFDTGTGYPTGTRGLFCYWRNTSKVVVKNAFRALRVKHS